MEGAMPRGYRNARVGLLVIAVVGESLQGVEGDGERVRSGRADRWASAPPVAPCTAQAA